MKKFIIRTLSFALAMSIFIGCSNDREELAPLADFALTVVTTNPGARTEYNADLQDITWSTGDVAQVLVKGTYANCTAVIDANDARIASFTWAPGSYISYVPTGTHIVQGYAPQKAYAACTYDGNGSARTCATRLGLKLPAAQTATTMTFDKAADILVADNKTIQITAADLSAGTKTVENFRFRRLVAITEFTYRVTNATLTAADEQVTSVSFQVLSKANDKFLAGKMYIKPTEEGAKHVNASNVELANNNDYFYADDSNTVTVTLTDKPALKHGFTAWFVTSPVTLAADDELIFTIKTASGATITKHIPAVGREVTFSTTKKNTLTIDLDNSVAIEGLAGNTQPALGLSWLEIPAAMTGSEMGGVTTSNLFMHTFYYGSESEANRNYTVCYDKGKLTTYWVAYPLSSAHIGSIDRTDKWAYVSSSLLSEQLQPNIQDGSYRSQSSGGTNNYSRGHLLPSASRTKSTLMNEQTFLSVNLVPQIHNNFNGGVWMYLESAVRNAINGKTLFVVTGTALQKGSGQTEEIGTMEKTYDRSGKEIAVPRYFYKVILKVNSTTNPTAASAIGFWFTNQGHSGNNYESFAMSVDAIESKLGMDFFPNLPNTLENTAEQNASWTTFLNF